MANATSTTLSHVNTPAAQTWNYLRINDIALTVPDFHVKGTYFNTLPHLFDAVETGCGSEVVRWADMHSQDTTYIEVKSEVEREEPIVVTVGAGLSANTGILVREGATCTIVLCATPDAAESADEAAETGAPTSATLLRVVCERDAHVNLVEVVAAGEKTQHIECVGLELGERASADVRQYLLGGKTCAAGICINLAGHNSSVELGLRYLANEGQLVDVNHLVRQRGRNTRSNLIASGVLGEGASKTLRETIDLSHGAKGAKGDEAETVVVTGEHVTNKTLPTILCDEDDVQGNHGATIGSISPAQLGYLADRGFTEQQVNDLFVRAVFSDALIHTPDAGTRAHILARAAEVLGQESADDLVTILGLEED